MTEAAPVVRLKPKGHLRAERGCPWIYSNEVEMDPPTRAIAAGSLVRVETASGETLDWGWFNPSTLISVRRLETGPEGPGADHFRRRLAEAHALRARLLPEPWWRWVHAEADGLPGVIVDRFGDVVSIQLNSAGAESAADAIVSAVRDVAPEVRAIVARNDSVARAQEGLERTTTLIFGSLDGPVRVRENGAEHLADLLGGQKTGWFYDHRANRALVRRLCDGARALDLYGYAGAFAVQAALGGARSVLTVDRSEQALSLAAESARLNQVADRVACERADVFSLLDGAERGAFDVVVADPPAFAKSRKDLPQALKGYRKLARAAARVVAPGGFLFIASCSHAVDAAAFQAETSRGVREAGRQAKILARTGADVDHPEHPGLPESAYLKGLLYALP